METPDLSSDFTQHTEPIENSSFQSSEQDRTSSTANKLPIISDFNRLEKLTNEGTTCETYKWTWCSRVYFVKRLKHEFLSSPQHRHAFEKEFELGSRLDHVSLPRYVAFHQTPQECYIVMEYIDGKTLKDLWHKPVTFDRQTTYRAMNQLIDVVEYLHRNNIMHYDLIPQNVMLTNNLNNVVLLDLDKAFNSAYSNNSGDPSRFGLETNGDASPDVDFRGIGIILKKGFWGGMEYGELGYFYNLCNKLGVTAEELREALSHKYDDVYVSDQIYIKGRTCDAYEGDWKLYPVLIKRLKPSLLNNRYYLDKFVNECEVMSESGYPIEFAHYHFIRKTPEDCFVVVDKPDGISLAQMLAEDHPWIDDFGHIKGLIKKLNEIFFFLWQEGLDNLRFLIEDIFINPDNGFMTIANFREILDTTITDYKERWTEANVSLRKGGTNQIIYTRKSPVPDTTIPFEIPQFYIIIKQIENYLDLFWLEDLKKACLYGASYKEFSKIIEKSKLY